MSIALLRTSWFRVLVVGSVIYALVTAAAVDTRNANLIPAVLLLGASLIPVAFVIYMFERLAVPARVLPAIAICFAAGGSVGVAAASVLEYQTLRDLGTLPMLAVGLIEESVKLAVPLWLFLRRRFPAPADGMLFGVAAGTGFAVLESMGYGLVALIHSRGRIGAAEEVLLIRGVAEPLGHAAWTGLVAAALWGTRCRRAHARLQLVAAFAAAVALHALWDTTDSTAAHIAIGLVSAAMLTARIRQVRPAQPSRRRARPIRRSHGPAPDPSAGLAR